MNEKPYINKYICYGEEDGSFSWGRIKDEGVVNTPLGPKEVFVLTDRMTCRVSKSEVERNTIKAISTKIGAGTSGPIKMPGQTDKARLPEYQHFGDCKQLPSNTKCVSSLPAVQKTPEGQGIVPKLEKDIQMSKGLDILQMAGDFHSQMTGRDSSFLLRKYGYDTNIRKESINLETDVVDTGVFDFGVLTDDELFMLAMQAKIQVATSRLNQGMRNILMLKVGVLEEKIVEEAVRTLKNRRNIL